MDLMWGFRCLFVVVYTCSLVYGDVSSLVCMSRPWLGEGLGSAPVLPGTSCRIAPAADMLSSGFDAIGDSYSCIVDLLYWKALAGVVCVLASFARDGQLRNA
jgi:hypothetical protein